MTHTITRCRECKTVMGQCRCPSPNKTVIWSQCNVCEASVSKRTENCETCELRTQEALKFLSERDALKAELKRFEEWEVDRSTVEQLKADNERLRAELEAEQQKPYQFEKRQEIVLRQLTELREAAEDARETLRQLGWKPTRLDAVLAKLPVTP